MTAIDRNNRRRPDGTPVWPLQPTDRSSTAPQMCAAEQRKQHAILMRRVAAAGEAMG